MQQRILVIEDNPADAALIHIYLEEAAFGHVIFQADSLKRGFEIIQSHAIDLVLLDLSLTDSIGFGTLEKYLAEYPRIPVIVMTGLNNDIVGVQCVRAGAQDFLVKGEFDSKALVKSIRHSLQRFQTQIKLRESAQKLSIQQTRIREAQELAQFANWEMDLVTNSMKWADEMYRIFGIPSHADQRSLSDYMQYVFFDDREKVEAFFTAAMKDEEIHKIEHRIIVGSKVKYLALRAKIRFDQNTGQLLLIGSAQDISEQVMPYVSEGSAGNRIFMSLMPEFNTNVQKPLFDALNHVHLLQKTATPTQMELLSEFRKEMNELWLSLQNLLTACSATEGRLQIEPSIFSTSHLVQNFRDWADTQARSSGAPLQAIYQEELPPNLEGDERLISLLWFNLFKCIDGSPSNSAPLMRVSYTHESPGHGWLTAVWHPFSRQIPASGLEAFLSADKSFEFTHPGLQSFSTALFMAKYLLNVLNGKYAVSHGPDGTCDSLEVQAPVKLPVTPRAPMRAQDPLPDALRILLVDDHALHRIAGRSVLSGLIKNAAIELADSGAHAIELTARQNFDLIFIDLHMPQLNGMETLAGLKTKVPAHLIAVSPNPNPDEESLCLSKGFHGYIGKPFQAAVLGDVIRNVFNR